jgi:TRAP-type C4-dicarboxylate transport system permease small subunit
VARVDPPPAGDEEPRREDDAPDRPMGLELGTLGTGDAVAAEEQERREDLPRVFLWVDTVLKAVMVALLVVLIIAVGVNVFGRFVLNQSLAGTDELSRFLFIWVIFLGAALAHLHREHIAVTLFVERMPQGLQRAAVVLQELVILTVVVALLLSARQVIAISPGSSPLLDVPLTWINASVPFAAVVMGVVTLQRLAVALRPRSGERG